MNQVDTTFTHIVKLEYKVPVCPPSLDCVCCCYGPVDMVVPAGGITLQVDSDGRETGEAYVEFVKPEDAEKALYKDRQMIGHRFVALWLSPCTCVFVCTVHTVMHVYLVYVHVCYVLLCSFILTVTTKSEVVVIVACDA